MAEVGKGGGSPGPHLMSESLTLNYKMVAMDDFQPSYLVLPYYMYPGIGFWSCFFYWRLQPLFHIHDNIW